MFDADDGDPVEVLVTVVDGRMEYWEVRWGDDGDGRTLAEFDAWVNELV